MSAQQKHVYDIQELPPDRRMLCGRQHRRGLYAVAQAAIWSFNLYFVVRLTLCFSSPNPSWRIWATLLVEAVLAHMSRHDQRLTVAAGDGAGEQPRQRLRLQGTQDLPRVDVLVPCCGEPVEVIVDTVRAACTMEYPRSRLRVRVLDDGASAALEAAVAALRPQWPHLFYHTRGKQSGKVFAKAGNLNYALSTLQAQDEVQPDFCAVFDADSIPMPDFLRATLPHLLRNPQTALLTTRQYFLNLPAGDPLSQSRLHFYACENAELDVGGRARDAGSGALFRRAVILEAGGYPTYSFSEDWQLSLVLQGLGHPTIQIQEPLQYGLVPTSLDGHIAQRSRWHIGHSQQIRALFPPTSHSLPRPLQWSIAWNGTSILARSLGCLLAFALVPLLLASGGALIPVASPVLVQTQLLLAVLHVALTWAYGCLQSAHTGFQTSPFAHVENTWLAGAQLHAVLRFHLFASRPKGSFVTGSSANAWNRSSAPSALQQLCHNLWHNGIAYSVLLLLATLGAVAFSIWSTLTATDSDPLLRLLTTVAWPPMLHILYLAVISYWAPVSYLLNPPRYPDRKAGLALSPSGVAFPTREIQEGVQPQGKPSVGFYRHCILATLVLVVLLGAGLML
ncbi:glycosyl transferase [Aspergillus heteromorphus CBS 117.55]|uniref:Glycosyl transferase n=1 Tax=Aspergillus heteromorphus CBS 117.55 TaxID=1448321 RepID=A0A317VXL1_9EURO|nr:glycosyl transferase [Aspergillus heteromorphus CBS 117.55]PWY79176.1 glycosyl transferase [Aspergillus heteromorphus CBS 117.55]